MVIGSGAGGGAAALVLARAGRRTLLVERGQRLRDPSLFQDERAMIQDRAASDDRPLEVNGRRERLYIGGVPGGGTALFGAVLMRPGPSDFEPGRHYGDRIPRAVWQWPVSYQELEPFFEWAEDLYGVAADHREAPPHVGWRDKPFPQTAAALHPLPEALRKAWRREGLRPFVLPLAIDQDRCLRCPRCPGYLCPNGSRRSSTEVLRTALAASAGRDGSSLETWTGWEAQRLRLERGRARSLVLRQRKSGALCELRARHYVVAAGALGTPLLLQRSEAPDASGQLGRNHMCHLGAVGAGVFARAIGADRTYLKQVGLTDYYLGAPGMPHKLGYAQLIPVPGPHTLASELGAPLPGPLARALHARSILLVGSVEDLPRPGNRVVPRGERGARLHRRFDRFDRERARWLARRLARLLRRGGAALALPSVAHENHLHAAHQVGTCRAGADPRHSVVDPRGRVHGLENVHVVDGSTFPTSLGVGPALTIAANALRIATGLVEEGSR